MAVRSIRYLGAVATAALLVAVGQARPLIIAHRGASSAAPENTLAAYKLAWEQGADAAETDVWLTKDGQVVCVHDENLKRTTGLDKPVKQATMEEIAKVSAGAWKSGRYATERVPLLADVLATVPPGKRFFLEIKDNAEIVPHVKQVLDASGKASQVTIICFDQDVLDAAHAAMPELPTYWLVGAEKDEKTGEYKPINPADVASATKYGYSGLNVSWRGVDKALVDAAHAASQELYAWTVDDPVAAKRLAELGVAGITTNTPDVMLAAFGEGEVDESRLSADVLHERYTVAKKAGLPMTIGKQTKDTSGTLISAPPPPGMVPMESYTVSGPGAGTITGKVTRPDGQPVKEILFGNRPVDRPTVIMLSRLPLQADGSFRASIRPTVTDYVFAAAAPDMAPVIVGPFKGDAPELKQPLNLTLTPGFDARIRLVDGSKKPVANATIEAGYGNETLPALPFETIVKVKSDAKGEATLPHTTKEVSRRLKIATEAGDAFTIIIDCQPGVVDEVELVPQAPAGT